MSTTVDLLVRAIPGRRQLLAYAARLPPSWRSAATLRICSAIARRTLTADDYLTTNLGIASPVQCQVAGNRLSALFGSPDLYFGERGALRVAAALSHHADGFLDVGAHLGYFTFYVRARGPAGLPIVAVEPDPVLSTQLRINLDASQCGDVRALPIAIGAEDGQTSFHRDLSDPYSGSLTRDFASIHELETIPMEVQTASRLLRDLDWRRACVKVDVEGAESDFITGATGAIDRIAFLIMEVLGPAHEQGFVQRMIRAGWRAYYLRDFTVVPSVDGSFEYVAPDYNWLFCRETPEDLARLLPPPLAVSRR